MVTARILTHTYPQPSPRRPGSIQTTTQENFVKAFEKCLKQTRTFFPLSSKSDGKAIGLSVRDQQYVLNVREAESFRWNSKVVVRTTEALIHHANAKFRETCIAFTGLEPVRIPNDFSSLDSGEDLAVYSQSAVVPIANDHQSRMETLFKSWTEFNEERILHLQQDANRNIWLQWDRSLAGPSGYDFIRPRNTIYHQASATTYPADTPSESYFGSSKSGESGDGSIVPSYSSAVMLADSINLPPVRSRRKSKLLADDLATQEVSHLTLPILTKTASRRKSILGDAESPARRRSFATVEPFMEPESSTKSLKPIEPSPRVVHTRRSSQDLTCPLDDPAIAAPLLLDWIETRSDRLLDEEVVSRLRELWSSHNRTQNTSKRSSLGTGTAAGAGVGDVQEGNTLPPISLQRPLLFDLHDVEDVLYNNLSRYSTYHSITPC